MRKKNGKRIKPLPKEVVKIGKWRYETALSSDGQVRTVVLCWKGEREEKGFRIVQYRSGNISCSECVAARCFHIRKAVKAKLFDRKGWTECLVKRGIVLPPPATPKVKPVSDLIAFG